MAANKLSPAQSFYLEHFAESKTAEELSAELDMPLRLVKVALKKWQKNKDAMAQATKDATTATPAKPALPHDQDFHRTSESGARRIVAMTEARSFADDQVHRPDRAGYLERNKHCIHIIDPTQPVQ